MHDCVCALSISLCACMCLLAFESRKSLTTNAVFQKKSTCNLPTKAHDGSASTQMQSKKKSRSSSRKTRPMKEVNEPAPKQMQKHISQCEKPLKPLYPPLASLLWWSSLSQRQRSFKATSVMCLKSCLVTVMFGTWLLGQDLCDLMMTLAWYGRSLVLLGRILRALRLH